ncbi:MAG: diphthine--ammonia ligase [Methanosarcinales archaeon]|nr:diphthine--ammonia ligase [Methanosarcinales archaeon]MCD4767843.1 diphthine--ammonia ligase [Methanosarcinales archaeon]
MNSITTLERNPKANVVVSWTGGKDGCLSCYQAMSDGFNVTHFLNFRDTKKKGSHTINPKLLSAQMQATGIPSILTDFVSYEKEFKNVIQELNDNNAAIEGAVFGHIQTHNNLADRICNGLGVKLIMPLWMRDSEQIISDLVDAGFKTIIVSVKGGLLGKEWLGRPIDHKFARDLRRYNSAIDPCGEGGEFHTFVIDGPLFKHRLKIVDSKNILQDGYWLLDVLQFEVEDK